MKADRLGSLGVVRGKGRKRGARMDADESVGYDCSSNRRLAGQRLTKIIGHCPAAYIIRLR